MAEKNIMVEIQQVIKDLGEAQQKTEEAQQKTQAVLQEVAGEQKKTEAAQQKTEEAQQKTQAVLQEVAGEQKKTETALQELKQEMANFKQHVEKQGRDLHRSIGHINGRWGQFMENLAEGDLLDLLRGQDIGVDKVLPNLLALEDDGHTRKAEYDLVAHNGEEVVVVEVKTTLFEREIDIFIDKLKQFRSYFPAWKKYKVYGAVIFMGEARDEIGSAAQYASKEGLLLVRCPKGAAGMAEIVNPKGFAPKLF